MFWVAPRQQSAGDFHGLAFRRATFKHVVKKQFQRYEYPASVEFVGTTKAKVLAALRRHLSDAAVSVNSAYGTPYHCTIGDISATVSSKEPDVVVASMRGVAVRGQCMRACVEVVTQSAWGKPQQRSRRSRTSKGNPAVRMSCVALPPVMRPWQALDASGARRIMRRMQRMRSLPKPRRSGRRSQPCLAFGERLDPICAVAAAAAADGDAAR